MRNKRVEHRNWGISEILHTTHRWRVSKKLRCQLLTSQQWFCQQNRRFRELQLRTSKRQENHRLVSQTKGRNVTLGWRRRKLGGWFWRKVRRRLAGLQADAGFWQLSCRGVADFLWEPHLSLGGHNSWLSPIKDASVGSVTDNSCNSPGLVGHESAPFWPPWLHFSEVPLINFHGVYSFLQRGFSFGFTL